MFFAALLAVAFARSTSSRPSAQFFELTPSPPEIPLALEDRPQQDRPQRGADDRAREAGTGVVIPCSYISMQRGLAGAHQGV